MVYGSLPSDKFRFVDTAPSSYRGQFTRITLLMIKRITVLLTVLMSVWFLSPTAHAITRLDTLDAAIKNIKPFRSGFEQVYYDAFQDKQIVSRGTLSFMQPGLMRWFYQTPDEMLFIVGREKVWLYDPLLENVTIQDLSSVSGLRSLRFLSGEETLTLLFKEINTRRLLITKDKAEMIITLAPLEKNQSLAELQVAFDLQQNQIVEFVLIDHNDNYRRIKLFDIKTDFTLKETDFVFKVTEDMEVIQGISN